VRTVDGKGRRAAIEILINTPLVADLIKKGEVYALKEVMSKSTEQGMQTFDQALYQLYSTGDISYDAALSYADSANDLRLMIKLSGGERSDMSVATQGLTMESSEDDLGI